MNTWFIILVAIVSMIGAFAAIAAGVLLYLTRRSDIACLWLQKKWFKGMPANSYHSVAEQVDTVLDNGVRYRNEIQYSAEYPNSYLDIYYAAEDLSIKRPTMLFLHGGGWIFGGRASGDPLAGTNGDIGSLLREIASHGFNVVSIDYCLAPEWRYPKQYFQLNDAIAFLVERSREYHLDMDNVVLMGGSAGAVMTAQYGLMVSNPDYAAMMGIRPAIRREAVKALLIDGAPMNTALMKTAPMDQFGKLLLRTWFGTNDLTTSEPSKQIHAARWVDERYPPCFLTAGNSFCFPKHAEELEKVLDAKGIEHDSYYVDSREARAMHGYIVHFATDSNAGKGLERMLAFAQRMTA
ncbi:alpha/beta hydrolase [Cohnella thailandensis]|uniref:Alpha/beta hydrolase n=1 Tax=Cohnella thailandensis TaxID=557557 RepID=A0A841SY90_9BACL|nr:alpha/beta hydrolase [Cohnella thailandensis]MBB6637193.1 alpha/beta hydrolase [Cohnella thailandensis]MBP1976985.1 acetyl esterase/lipase [Cohnella thailandensis]